MTETKRRMIAFQIQRVCDHCNDGMMEYDHKDDFERVLHRHRCTACGLTNFFSDTYPYINFEPEGNGNG